MVFAMRPWRGLVGILERRFGRVGGIGVCTGGDDDAVEGLSCHVWVLDGFRTVKKLCQISRCQSGLGFPSQQLINQTRRASRIVCFHAANTHNNDRNAPAPPRLRNLILDLHRRIAIQHHSNPLHPLAAAPIGRRQPDPRSSSPRTRPLHRQTRAAERKHPARRGRFKGSKNTHRENGNKSPVDGKV